MEKNSPVERFIGEKYKDAHLSKIMLNPERHKELLTWLNRPQGFLLFQGCPGCGKTYTSVAITRSLAERAPKRPHTPGIFYYTEIKIYDEFKEMYQNKWGDASLKERMNSSLLLTIDDFGSSRGSEWQVEVMSQIIEERYSSQKPTILTTNLTFPQIETHYHPRVRSRLEAAENLIIQEWERDLRQEGY